MKKESIFGLLLLPFFSCSSPETHNDSLNSKNAKQEIEKAERDFAQMAADKGIAEAFHFFADSNATIKRQNDTLIHGKEAIRSFTPLLFIKRQLLNGPLIL